MKAPPRMAPGGIGSLIPLGLLCVLLLAPGTALAQTDVQLWTSASLRAELVEDFRLELTQHLRFDEDVSRVLSIMPELSASYDPAKPLRLSLGYRFIYEREQDRQLDDAHRLTFDARLRGDLDPIRISYRLRIQEVFEQKASGLEVRNTLRNRLGVSWDTDTPLTPEVSAEIYTRIGGDKAALFHKLRLTAGASYDIDDVELELFYRLELPIDQPLEPVLHIIGLGFRYDLSLVDEEEDEPGSGP